MASSDASPFAIKNQAYRITFPILDADGDLVTAAAGLDSEVSKDGGTFANCTNEATEIDTSSGMYYLDLTATEMNADTVAIIIKTSTSGAKTTPIVIYPVTLSEAMLGVNEVQHAGTAQTAGDVVPLVDNIESRLGTPSDLGGGATIAANLADIEAQTADIGAAGAGLTALASQASVNTIDDFLDTEIAAIKTVTDLLNTAQAEPTGAPAVNETPLEKLAYLFMALRNKITVTASSKTFFDDGGSAEWSKALSDDGTTYTEAEGL